MLLLIHHKVEEKDRVLTEIRENVLILNQKCLNTKPNDNLSFHVHSVATILNRPGVVLSLPKKIRGVT